MNNILNKITEQAKQIIEGYTNLFIKKSVAEAIAEDRLRICETCPFKKKTACGKCGCSLQAKTRSLSTTCPALKWRGCREIYRSVLPTILIIDEKEITINKVKIYEYKISDIEDQDDKYIESTYFIIEDTDKPDSIIKTNNYKIK